MNEQNTSTPFPFQGKGSGIEAEKLIAYISEGGNIKEIRTFLLNNNNAQKELLFLLHQIANGLPQGTRITFSTEV